MSDSKASPGPPVRPSGGGNGFASVVRSGQKRASMAKNLATRTRAARRNLVLDKNRGLPLRELLQQLYTIERNRSVREALTFAVFVAVFLFVCYQLYDTHTMYNTNSALSEAFLDEEFDDVQYRKNFYEIMTMEEFWSWVNGPLIRGLYPDEFYDGTTKPPSQQGVILQYMRLVGEVQFRQMRVPPDSCETRRFTDQTAWHDLNGNGEVDDGEMLGRYDTKDGSCYAEFTVSLEETRPFQGRTGTWYNWTDGHHSMSGLIGFGPTYGTGGYVSYLPNDKEGAQAAVARMIADRWMDRGTRAVAVSFNAYNTQTRMVSVVRFLFEHFHSGHITKSVKLLTHPVLVYEAKTDLVRGTLEFVYMCLWAYYAFVEMSEFWHFRPRLHYFRSFRNLFEIAMVLVNLVFFRSWITFLFAEKRVSFDVNNPVFVDMYDLADAYIMTFSWAAGLALAYFLKVFEFLALSKKVSTLWLTLSRALSDIAPFLVGFVIIVAGFSFMGMYLFGGVMQDFHNFQASFSTLLRLPLGDFDYSDLSTARPALAAMFFNLYVASVFLVIMNMFIGIITKYFDEVHDEARKTDRWKASALTWERSVMQLPIWRYEWFLERVCKRRPVTHDKVEVLLRKRTVIDAEQAFMRYMEKCVDAAKTNNNIDLYHHVYRMYLLKDADQLFVGVHNLCALVRKDACPAGKHERTKCEAFTLVALYNKVKSTTMIGNIRAHHPVQSDVLRLALDVYTVRKVSNNGLVQMRKLVVHPDKGLMLNFTQHMKLRKAIPVKRLEQVDESLIDDSALSLTFRGQETMDADRPINEQSARAMETLYSVRFLTPTHKDQFMMTLLNAKAKADDPSYVPEPASEHKTLAGQLSAGKGMPQLTGKALRVAQRIDALLDQIDKVSKEVVGSDDEALNASSGPSGSGGGGGSGSGSGGAAAPAESKAAPTRVPPV